jgi:Na+/proline symporter
MNAIVRGLVADVAAQLAIGLFVSRRIRSEADHLVAGRSFGPMLATFTSFATWFGAETCAGAAGAVYQEGWRGGRADPFGYTICLLILGLVFASSFARQWPPELAPPL